MNQSSRRHSLYASLLHDHSENPQEGRTPGLWVFGFLYADRGTAQDYLPRQEQTSAHSINPFLSGKMQCDRCLYAEKENQKRAAPRGVLLLAQTVGFEPTWHCCQIDFESISLRPLRYVCLFSAVLPMRQNHLV